MKARGRCCVVWHTGHQVDAHGNIVKLGRELRRTPLCDNTFTDIGKAMLLDDGTHPLSLGIAADVGSPPIRYSDTLVSVATTRSGTPDADGWLWWRTTYRVSFPANVSLGVVTVGAGVAKVASSTGLTGSVSVAPLFNAGGSFGRAIINMAVEHFDLVWEYTEYVKASDTYTLTVDKVAGGAVTTTEHTVTFRPCNFTNVSDGGKGWKALSTMVFPEMSRAVGSYVAGSGTLGDYGSAPTFGSSYVALSVAAPLKVQFGFDAVSVDCAHLLLGHSEWQLSFDPPLPKTGDDILELDFGFLVADRG